MEEKCYNGLPLMISPPDGEIYNNVVDACYCSEADPRHRYTSNESPSHLRTLPQWIYQQQIPQNYFQFLTDHSSCAFHPSPSSGFRAIPTKIATYKGGCVKSPNEVSILSNFSGSENPTPSQGLFPNKNPNEDYDYAATNFPAKINQSSQSSVNDSKRRKKIAEGIEALQEFLPRPDRGGKAALLDDVIDYVKRLQFQIKELSQSKLGGESSNNSSVLHEGYGHYLQEDETSNESLEEMIGKLMEVNPFAATQLLESRGLVMMPIALAEGLVSDV